MKEAKQWRVLTGTTTYTYSVLLVDVEKERERQEIARKEEALREHLREHAKQETGKAAQKPRKKSETLPPPTHPSRAYPFAQLAPPGEAPSFLQGWAGPEPGVKEREQADMMMRIAGQVLSNGNRIARHGPESGELPDFEKNVIIWRELADKMLLKFTDQKVVHDLRNFKIQFNEQIDKLGILAGTK